LITDSNTICREAAESSNAWKNYDNTAHKDGAPILIVIFLFGLFFSCKQEGPYGVAILCEGELKNNDYPKLMQDLTSS